MTASNQRRAVDPAEIDAQREKGWVDFHPETYCHRCGQRNVISWHAPNDVWNEVVDSQWQGIVCPQCFTELARGAGVKPSVWQLIDGDRLRAILAEKNHEDRCIPEDGECLCLIGPVQQLVNGGTR